VSAVALLVDVFGFLSVVLRGVTLSAQSLTLGGIVFLMLLARPLSADLGSAGTDILRRCRLILLWSAGGFALAEVLTLLLQGAVLMGTLDISAKEAMGAGFAHADLVILAAALLVAFVARHPLTGQRAMALALLGGIMLVAQVATSHAASRLDDRLPLALADVAHMAAAAVWIGGLPYFMAALGRTRDGAAWRLIGRRYSIMSMASVALLLAGGITMAVPYVGSLAALYGTTYGVMIMTKALLLGGLLFLGGMNYRVVERLRRDPRTPIHRLKRFTEVELGIGLTVLFAAASLTSQPPGVDLPHDRASLSEIVERLTPQWPRLESPDHASLAISELQARIAAAKSTGTVAPQAYVPGDGELPARNAMDIAWSEYNHHWAGLFVLAIGFLALLERSGRAPWARHWPLLFLALACFLLIRSDPEVWPLGDVGLLASLRDPEVVQHRIFVLLIAVFGFFEWRVRTGRIMHRGAALVFPLLTAVGGALLLTHSHALSNLKDQLLIEITHVPLALAGITAGWARWLELRIEGRASHIAAWVWPIAFVVVGLVLLLYREA
jgi:putative copper resistance protein D